MAGYFDRLKVHSISRIHNIVNHIFFNAKNLGFLNRHFFLGATMAFVNSLCRLGIAELPAKTFIGINRIIRRRVSYTCSCRSPVNLAYASYESTEVSSPGAGDAAPVVIMHGLFGSKTNWNSLAKSMQQRTKRKVIAVDARNHGDSAHSSEMTYADMASDVVGLMESLDLDKTIAVGHSMGGAAMMCLALYYPQLVEKLVVVDMSPVRTSDSLAAMGHIFDAMLSVDIKTGEPLSVSRKLVDQQLAAKIHSDTLRQFLLMNLVESEPGKCKWRVNLPVLAENFAHHIAKFPKFESKTFDGPTLFIGGEKSDYIRKEDHTTIKTLFPRAEIRYIAGAGHWVQSDKPAEFLDMIVDFINQPTV